MTAGTVIAVVCLFFAVLGAIFLCFCCVSRRNRRNRGYNEVEIRERVTEEGDSDDESVLTMGDLELDIDSKKSSNASSKDVDDKSDDSIGMSDVEDDFDVSEMRQLQMLEEYRKKLHSENDFDNILDSHSHE